MMLVAFLPSYLATQPNSLQLMEFGDKYSLIFVNLRRLHF